MGNAISEPDAPSRGTLATQLAMHVNRAASGVPLAPASLAELDDDLSSLEATIAVFDECLTKQIDGGGTGSGSQVVCDRLNPTLQQAKQNVLSLLGTCARDEVRVERLLALLDALRAALKRYDDLHAPPNASASGRPEEAAATTLPPGDDSAASALAEARRACKVSAELMQGHSNVARSVLSEELRVLDDEASEAAQERVEAADALLAEAIARADEAKRVAEGEAARVVAAAKQQAEQERARLADELEQMRAQAMETAIAEAQRASKASAELMQGHSNVARAVLSEELRVLDDEASEAAQAKAEYEVARHLEAAAAITAETHAHAKREAAQVLRQAEEEAARMLTEAEAHASERRASGIDDDVVAVDPDVSDNRTAPHTTAASMASIPTEVLPGEAPNGDATSSSIGDGEPTDERGTRPWTCDPTPLDGWRHVL